MEIFLKFYLGFLLVIAIVVGVVILINRRAARYDAEFEGSSEHQCDAPYPRFHD
jgi:hypothetical protein